MYTYLEKGGGGQVSGSFKRLGRKQLRQDEENKNKKGETEE